MSYLTDENGKPLTRNGKMITAPPTGISDVTIDGESIVEDGVAKIAAHKSRQTRNVFGTVIMGVDGDISAYRNTNREIGYRYLPLNSIDAAVKFAMCDGKGAAWTAEEQENARERIGLKSAILIGIITIEEEVSAVKLFSDSDHPLQKCYIYMSTPVSAAASVCMQRRLIDADKKPIIGKTVILYNVAATDKNTDSYYHCYTENGREIIDYMISKYNTGNKQLAVFSEGQYGESLKQAVGFSGLDVVCTNNTKLPIGTVIELYGMRA